MASALLPFRRLTTPMLVLAEAALIIDEIKRRLE
jgi:hypothetical protein